MQVTEDSLLAEHTEAGGASTAPTQPKKLSKRAEARLANKARLKREKEVRLYDELLYDEELIDGCCCLHAGFTRGCRG